VLLPPVALAFYHIFPNSTATILSCAGLDVIVFVLSVLAVFKVSVFFFLKKKTSCIPSL